MKNLLALFTCLLLGTSAHAQLLFDNGVTAEPSDSGGGEAQSQFPIAGNVFSPLITGTANHVVFNGSYSYLYADPLPTDNFTLKLYSVAGGVPDVSQPFISSGLTSLSRTFLFSGSNPSEDVYQFTGDLTTPLDLTLGTSYYLGFTDTDSPPEGFGLTYALSGSSTESFTYTTFISAFSPAPAAFQFQLSQTTAAVPEPSSYALGLIMLTLLAFEIRRRRALANL